MLRPKKLSKKGAQFIAKFEGFRATPYNDAANNATIGFGHLLHYGPVDHRDHGLSWSREHALAVLQKDAAKAAASVYKHTKIRRQSRFDALVSFAFNVGTGALESSTLLKKHNAGDYQGAANEFLKWDMAGGKHLPGLRARRSAEARLYLRGKYL